MSSYPQDRDSQEQALLCCVDQQQPFPVAEDNDTVDATEAATERSLLNSLKSLVHGLAAALEKRQC
jgi:hypothetical protein